jgi:hypothetical protein
MTSNGSSTAIGFATRPLYCLTKSVDGVRPGVSPKQHAFTGADHFDHWMIVLRSLKALQGYDTIIIGHGHAVSRSAIDSTMTYVKRAGDPCGFRRRENVQRNLKAAFPDLQQVASSIYPPAPSFTAPHWARASGDAWATWGTDSLHAAPTSTRAGCQNRPEVAIDMSPTLP